MEDLRPIQGSIGEPHLNGLGDIGPGGRTFDVVGNVIGREIGPILKHIALINKD